MSASTKNINGQKAKRKWKPVTRLIKYKANGKENNSESLFSSASEDEPLIIPYTDFRAGREKKRLKTGGSVGGTRDSSPQPEEDHVAATQSRKPVASSSRTDEELIGFGESAIQTMSGGHRDSRTQGAPGAKGAKGAKPARAWGDSPEAKRLTIDMVWKPVAGSSKPRQGKGTPQSRAGRPLASSSRLKHSPRAPETRQSVSVKAVNRLEEKSQQARKMGERKTTTKRTVPPATEADTTPPSPSEEGWISVSHAKDGRGRSDSGSTRVIYEAMVTTPQRQRFKPSPNAAVVAVVAGQEERDGGRWLNVTDHRPPWCSDAALASPARPAKHKPYRLKECSVVLTSITPPRDQARDQARDEARVQAPEPMVVCNDKHIRQFIGTKRAKKVVKRAPVLHRWLQLFTPRNVALLSPVERAMARRLWTKLLVVRAGVKGQRGRGGAAEGVPSSTSAAGSCSQTDCSTASQTDCSTASQTDCSTASQTDCSTASQTDSQPPPMSSQSGLLSRMIHMLGSRWKDHSPQLKAPVFCNVHSDEEFVIYHHDT